jgi:hypothetical protein
MYHMPDHRESARAESREVDSRVIVDGKGNEWVVREVDTPQSWAHGQSCLIFSSSSIVRRIWDYPRGWAQLSSRELLDLVGDVSPMI